MSQSEGRVPIKPIVLGLIANLALWTVAIALLLQGLWVALQVVFRRTIQRTRIAQGLCPRCEYPVGDLPSHKCPECGREWERATV